MTGSTSAVPAATVVLLRDRPDGLETLLLRRNAALDTLGGFWVFPGGAVDAEDAHETGDALATARRAAVREAREEAGLAVDEDHLVPLAHWCPPEQLHRRFATWFFVAAAGEGAVVVDDGEIKEARWLRPRDAIDLRDRGGLTLITPTWVTLHDLAPHASVADVLSWARETAPFFYETHIAPFDGGNVALFPGDAGWEDTDKDRPGPRHRLWMSLDAPWRLERDALRPGAGA